MRASTQKDAKQSLLYIVLLALVLSLTTQVSKASILINTEVVKKSVVFIYDVAPNGSIAESHPIGTGFLVEIPRNDGHGFYLLLLTARHIITPSWAGCSNSDPKRIALRLNLKAYDPSKNERGTAFVIVDLSDMGGSRYYHLSTDDEIDAAVVQLLPNEFPANIFDIAPISISNFATDEEANKLSTGDQIVSAGLVPGDQGQRRNYPVFKFGAISDKPSEPFYTRCSAATPPRPEKIWFTSINLYPGASGSPVFYVPPGYGGVAFGAPVARPVLIGIQSSSDVPADVAEMTPISAVFQIIQEMSLPDANLWRGLREPTKTSK